MRRVWLVGRAIFTIYIPLCGNKLLADLVVGLWLPRATALIWQGAVAYSSSSSSSVAARQWSCGRIGCVRHVGANMIWMLEAPADEAYSKRQGPSFMCAGDMNCLGLRTNACVYTAQFEHNHLIITTISG